ncbi:MAG: GNAT family N-acetyltransferase, partial [Melioribacteraceae bacterium]|nr:GNAT family N-acetyltransferase [Melioribacteraceae bacterium]
IGYWVGVDYWGKGICEEAVGMALSYCFEVLKFNKVTAHHFANNPTSGFVLIKNGMKKEGLHREHILKDGEYIDIIDYAILKSDYQNREVKFNDHAANVEQIDHIELFVPDREKAAEWYSNIFGLKIVKDFESWAANKKGPLMIETSIGQTKFALFQHENDGTLNPDYKLAAFRMNGPEFIKFLNQLNEIGLSDQNGNSITKNSVKDHEKAFSIYFVDPWGHPLEVTTYDYEYVKMKLKNEPERSG